MLYDFYEVYLYVFMAHVCTKVEDCSLVEWYLFGKSCVHTHDSWFMRGTTQVYTHTLAGLHYLSTHTFVVPHTVADRVLHVHKSIN